MTETQYKSYSAIKEEWFRKEDLLVIDDISEEELNTIIDRFNAIPHCTFFLTQDEKYRLVWDTADKMSHDEEEH